MATSMAESWLGIGLDDWMIGDAETSSWLIQSAHISKYLLTFQDLYLYRKSISVC